MCRKEEGEEEEGREEKERQEMDPMTKGRR